MAELEPTTEDSRIERLRDDLEGLTLDLVEGRRFEKQKIYLEGDTDAAVCLLSVTST